MNYINLVSVCCTFQSVFIAECSNDSYGHNCRRISCGKCVETSHRSEECNGIFIKGYKDFVQTLQSLEQIDIQPRK